MREPGVPLREASVAPAEEQEGITVDAASGAVDGAGPEPVDRTEMLSGSERAALAALVEGLFPGDELGPGAIDIGVVDYLERAFRGPYRGLLPTYRRVFAALDAAAARAYGRRFADLAPAPRDELIAGLERGQLEGLARADEHVFPMLWQHLREGLFGDPMHGGNRRMLGWRLIGFPGAQFGYPESDQQLDAKIDREPRSAADPPADEPEPPAR